jgi:hypothetical protein
MYRHLVLLISVFRFVLVYRVSSLIERMIVHFRSQPQCSKTQLQKTGFAMSSTYLDHSHGINPYIREESSAVIDDDCSQSVTEVIEMIV